MFKDHIAFNRKEIESGVSSPLSDEEVFARFFIAGEAARLGVVPRSTIPVKDVGSCVRRLLPSVARRVQVPSLGQNGEDIIQEFFCEAFDWGLTFYQARFSFKQYATLILFRAANRQKKLDRYEDDRRSVADAASIEGAALNIPDRTHQLQTYQEVLEVLNELGGKLKESCHEVWVNNRSISETAQMLGTTPNAVRLHVHRGRGEMLQRLPSYRLRQVRTRTRRTSRD